MNEVGCGKFSQPSPPLTITDEPGQFIAVILPCYSYRSVNRASADNVKPGRKGVKLHTMYNHCVQSAQNFLSKHYLYPVSNFDI